MDNIIELSYEPDLQKLVENIATGSIHQAILITLNEDNRMNVHTTADKDLTIELLEDAMIDVDPGYALMELDFS
jgi:hypothetical protein